MQFIQNGPDIPDALLQAHEEGRVVFFCGAGISYPAGLPGFEQLVRKLYEQAGEHPQTLESDALRDKKFDQTIGLLEKRIQGGRRNIRRHLPKILAPDLERRKRALTSHLALLTLGRNRSGLLRLVTTNFDTLFEKAADRYKPPSFITYPDPPLRAQWSGVVHLHGRMAENPIEDELEELILSDADFGHAYLTQGWAARFVTRLFREHTICFVGYSIDDPVLRYMTAAHALGEQTPEMFAFAPHKAGEAEDQKRAWQAKNVTPILYDERSSHRALHQTLRVWASVYRDRTAGKSRIISRLAHRPPGNRTPDNPFVSRVLWALSDKSGLPAQRFAELDPVPPLEWLSALSDYRYQHHDLPRFQVPVDRESGTPCSFSLLDRPAPYDKAHRMSLVTGIGLTHQWDVVMYQMARWLTRHMDDPELLLWLAERGGRLDREFIQTIEDQLNGLDRLEKEGKTEELAQIRAAAPRAIPRPIIRTLWRLLLSGRIKSRWQGFGIYQWQQRFRRDGLSFAVRMDLRELLTPKLHLSQASRSGDVLEEDASEDLKRSIAWKLEFAGTDVHSFLLDLQNTDGWQAALPALASDFQHLLHDALCLMRELGEADEHKDPSRLHVPSLCAPRSHFHFNTWVTLTDLVRDAWLAVLKDDPTRARQTALNWFAEPFPIFKRLGLFAATCESIDLHDEWLNCLLANQSRFLWAGETKSETLRLLKHKGNGLSDEQRERIESVIQSGPPDTILYSDADPERLAKATDWLIWERLSCLASSGALSDTAQTRLNELSLSHSDWQLDPDPHSEASPPGMGSGHEEFASLLRIEHAPRTRRELVAWLKRNEPRDLFDTDDWREVCGEHLFASSAALYDLAREGLWPVVRWQIALSTWRDERLVSRSWRLIARLVETMPATEFAELTPELSLWLEAAAKALELREDVFLNLCRRILELPYPTVRYTDASLIINDPISYITQALLKFWFRRPLSDNDGLPSDVGPLLTQVCDTRSAPCRAGRGILALHLITLFRLDPAWAQVHLLHLFDWSNPIEARTMWSGFLWSPRPYRPLLAAFKTHFLETARHYSELGDRAEIYATLLTYTALDRADVFSARELFDAFSSLSPEGLQASVQALVRAQQASGEQREESWKNRIAPFWHDVWPKSHHLNSKGIAELLARLAIAARDE
ncbi:anti-phage defense-associated sirtuin Dsr1, partial [Fluviibacter phosphoraccumulans]|uniref:anti-phage defense-associated sirtuin Dsr1 n=1 Tax=Fluviibacter phosphoraccumulans TaxID=1751046 RepID=UPI0024E1BFF2